jgi:hypothetical protein
MSPDARGTARPSGAAATLPHCSGLGPRGIRLLDWDARVQQAVFLLSSKETKP